MNLCLRHIGRNFEVIVNLINKPFSNLQGDKRNMLEKWCAASKVNTFEGLQELILLEDFKNCLLESLVVHLNEQKVTSLAESGSYG